MPNKEFSRTFSKKTWVFILCIIFITSTAGYSACLPAIDNPLLRAMREKNGVCVAFSLSALEECLEDMVDDLNKVIDNLFGDTLIINKKGFVLKDVETGELIFYETGIVVFGDDYAFVQLSVETGSTVSYGRHFCADRFGVYEYICRPTDDEKDLICTKWGKYKSILKIFPPKWGKQERIIRCHPCNIYQFGKEFNSWESLYPP